MESLILDSDVIIDYLRGHDLAKKYFMALKSPCFVSVITVAELYSGAKNSAQQSSLAACLQFFTILPIESETAKRAGLHRLQYLKSHSVGLADALIAATAEIYELKLITFNLKHFPMLKKIAVPYKKNNHPSANL